MDREDKINIELGNIACNDEESLHESKQDIEKFKQWAGEELANRFFAVKDRLKGELKDIYYWLSLEKKLGPDKELAHRSALDALEYAITDVELTPTKKERNELAKNGSEKIYEDERWLVLKINTFEASVKYGKNTQWCITGTNSGMDGGRSDWRYHSNNEFYFFIDKKKDHKYALEYKAPHNWCLYNDQDYVEVGEGQIAEEAVDVLGEPWNPNEYTSYPAFPKVEGLPDLQQAYKDAIANDTNSDYDVNDFIAEDYDDVLRKIKQYYRDVRESLNEDAEDKTLRFNKNELNRLIAGLKPYYKNLEVKKLPIDKLVKDNDLLNDDDLESYHQGEWKHAKAKDFHIDQNIIDNTRATSIPFVIQKKDGTLSLSDGRHRTRAAYNDGYKYVEYPTYIEECLKEYLDTIESNSVVYRDFPIMVTDEAYKLKNILEQSDVPYRIYYTGKDYFFQNALGNKTHYDMMNYAIKMGYATDDDYDEYLDRAYMVFIPNGFSDDGNFAYFTSLGEDGYYDCRVYDFGTIYVRNGAAYSNSLFTALGEPEREIWYNEWDEEVTILKNGDAVKVNIDDLQDNPENAITYDVKKDESLKEGMLDTLKSNLKDCRYDFRKKGWHDKYGNIIKIMDDDWEPEMLDWYYSNDTHIFENDDVRLECWVDEEDRVFTISVLWTRNNSKGEATKLIKRVVDIVPEDWKIQINNNVNKGYWAHIFSKYFPDRRYEDTYESLDEVLKPLSFI